MVVSMVSLGCAKNLVDSERMLAQIKEAGYTLTTNPAEADIAIVNTCGFIQSAKEEAIDTILELGALKASGSLKRLIVTGCLAERYKKEVAEQFPEADAVIGIGDQTKISEILSMLSDDEQIVQFAPKSCMPLTGKRVIATMPFTAYLKVAEGCSNGCTYCAIPQIRGKFRSVPMENVLGEDLYGESRLPGLLTALCQIDGFRWVRVLYCYPERITDELIDVIAREPKIVKYLDIPIQHCNAEVLKNMRRKCDADMLRTLFAKLRVRIPGITLRTTPLYTPSTYLIF